MTIRDVELNHPRIAESDHGIRAEASQAKIKTIDGKRFLIEPTPGDARRGAIKLSRTDRDARGAEKFKE